MQFFYYAKNEDQTACIRNHVFVRGITLGGPGLGIPRGFGLIIVEGRLLLIGYTVSRGDEQLQKSLAIRDKAAIKDLSDWFDSHVYVGGGLKVLQEPAAGNKLILREELRRILHGQKVPEAQIEQILRNREMSYDEIRALEASTSAPSQPTAQGTS